MNDFRIPDGWTLEPLERMPGYVLLSTPSPRQCMATIDFRAVFAAASARSAGWSARNGISVARSTGGRGWKQVLVDDAVAQLQEVLR